MTLPARRFFPAAKVLLATVLILGLAVLFARQLAPKMALGQLVLYCAAAVAAASALLVLAAICQLQFAQFILRMGGTDPQWFWFFRGEPPGLAEQRRQRAQDSSPDHRA
jgi:hypothetical protein